MRETGVGLARRGPQPLKTVFVRQGLGDERVVKRAGPEQNRRRGCPYGFADVALADLGQIGVVLKNRLALRYDHLFVGLFDSPPETPGPAKREMARFARKSTSLNSSP